MIIKQSHYDGFSLKWPVIHHSVTNYYQSAVVTTVYGHSDNDNYRFRSSSSKSARFC